MRNRIHVNRAAIITAAAVFAAAFAAGAADVVTLDGEDSLIARLAHRSLLLDGVVADDVMVVTGERGHVLISKDQGATWSQSKVPTRSMLTGVWFEDPQQGWVVGHDTLILKTADGGGSWEQVYSAPADQRPLFDVWFDDARTGFAIGAYGLFMTTTDGGSNWEIVDFDPVEYDPAAADGESDDVGEQMAAADETSDEQDEYDDDEWEDDLPFDYHLNQIAEAPNGMLYIAAESGNFFRSRDRGTSWEWLTPPYDGSFFGVLPLEGDELLLFGMRGNLFRSDDAGDSWMRVDTGTQATLNQGARLNDGRVVIAGMQGNLLVSDDGGRRFGIVQRPDRKHVAGVLPADADGAVVLGESGVFRLTAGLDAELESN